MNINADLSDTLNSNHHIHTPSYDGVFRKSTLSGGGNCVEVAKREDIVLVRDSKDSSSPILRFTHAEWKAFLGGVRNDEFEI
jgi:hypothetical protein